MKFEFQLAATISGVWVFERLPSSLIPKHDGAAAVFSFGNSALEGTVFERMVLHFDGKALLAGIEAWALRNRPAF